MPLEAVLFRLPNMAPGCWHEFRPIPPLLPDRRNPQEASGCPRHQAEVAFRVRNPPTLARSHPRVPCFVLVRELEDDSQASHDAAHKALHAEAAALRPRYFCQTCGEHLTMCRYHAILDFHRRASLPIESNPPFVPRLDGIFDQ